MPKRRGILFVIAGAVLIIAALLLFSYNNYVDYRAGQSSKRLLEELQAVIEESATDSRVEITSPFTETPEAPQRGETADPEGEVDSFLGSSMQKSLSPEMPVVMLDGNEYIGFLSIPDLALELPVMSDWSYAQLTIAPCRHYGSSRTDDLVIAGHNYKRHFGSLSTLVEGAEIRFTDMAGIENIYSVRLIEKLSPNEVDAVLNSEYDLVLYTCTPGGATRVVAFCDRIE